MPIVTAWRPGSGKNRKAGGSVRFDYQIRKFKWLKHKTMAKLMMKTSYIQPRYALSNELKELTVEAVGGEAYKFHVDDPGWRAENGPGCAILANAAAVFLAGMLDVRPAGKDMPSRIRWTNPRAVKALLFACLNDDGTTVRIEARGIDSAKTKELQIADAEWQLVLMDTPKNTSVTVTVTVESGPAGNDKYDSTLVAIFKIDSTGRQKLRRH